MNITIDLEDMEGCKNCGIVFVSSKCMKPYVFNRCYNIFVCPVCKHEHNVYDY
jgi:primosomal protein N'